MSALAKKLKRERAIRKKYRVVSGIKPNRIVEIEYRAKLVSLAQKLIDNTRTDWFDNNFTKDAGPEEQAKWFTSELKAIGNPLKKQASKIASIFANKAVLTHKKTFVSQMKRELGIDVTQLLKDEGLTKLIGQKIKENTALIKSIPVDYAHKAEAIVRRAMTQGTKEGMISQLTKLGDTTKNRAKLIARDQTAKFNLSLSRARQESVGIEEYIWSTSQDERVRDTHAEKEGQVFRWDEPPPDTGHPGEDVNCRCTARPVVNMSKVLGEEEGTLGPQDLTELEEETTAATVPEPTPEPTITAPDFAEVAPIVPTPSKASVDQWTEIHKDDYMSRIARVEGVTMQEYQDNADKVMKEWMDKANVFRRTHPSTLKKILRDGHFRNQFETGTSSGTLNTTLRTNAESKLGGVKKNASIHDRPKYGFLTHDLYGDLNPSAGGGLSEYGENIAVRFKSSVRKATTFTSGDSLNYTRGGRRANVLMSPINNPSHKSLYFDGTSYNDPVKLYKDNQQRDLVYYTEAQVHGRLTVDDIDVVNLVPQRMKDDDVRELITMLDDKGIKYNFIEPDGKLMPEDKVKVRKEMIMAGK